MRGGMTILYENAAQARKLRWVNWGTVLCFALCTAWAASLWSGPAPDGTAAILVALGGVAPLVGAVLFSRRYVVRLARKDAELLLTTLGFLSPAERRLPLERVAAATFDEGHAEGGPSVATPWIGLRIAGLRLPFVVDLRAERADARAIMALGTAHDPARRRRGG